MLVDGAWVDRWYDTSATGGRFVRSEARFRRWVTAGGGDFPAAPGRYHLYVSAACPWAHRCVIVRRLKGLEGVVGLSGVAPLMLEQGWEFTDDFPDPLHGHRYLHQIYTRADPRYTGRVTVPVLWDRQRGTIVSNESSEIVRMLNGAFDAWAEAPGLDLYPPPLRAEIDAVNARVYEAINNGVYKAGFATTQAAYEEAARALFAELDALEARLAGGARWLVGDRLTEADVRLFVTLVRFDAVYVTHFKCNLRRLLDYPALAAHTRRVHALPGVAETVDLAYTKRHYFGSHRTINPHGIVPLGPAVDVTTG